MRYLIITSAVLLAACTPKNNVARINDSNAAAIVRNAMGTSILGARGATSKDQDAIDDTVAGPCAIGAFTPTECARHNH